MDVWRSSDSRSHPIRDAELDHLEHVLEHLPGPVFAFDEFGALGIRHTAILDNLSARKGEQIRRWARKNRVELCFTPTYHRPPSRPAPRANPHPQREGPALRRTAGENRVPLPRALVTLTP